MALATTHVRVAPVTAPGDDPRDSGMIRAFFERNPDLVPVANAIAERLHAAFPDDGPPVFQLLMEPEEGDEPVTLFVIVDTTLDPDIAEPRLRALYPAWLLDVVRRTQGRLQASVGYA